MFFWEKWASTTEGDEDKFNFYEIENDPRIREVIRNFESRIIGDDRQDVRLGIAKLYRDTLAQGLGLLGIAAPERM